MTHDAFNYIHDNLCSKTNIMYKCDWTDRWCDRLRKTCIYVVSHSLFTSISNNVRNQSSTPVVRFGPVSSGPHAFHRNLRYFMAHVINCNRGVTLIPSLIYYSMLLLFVDHKVEHSCLPAISLIRFCLMHMKQAYRE